jgi:KUP system potassium uptake protein
MDLTHSKKITTAGLLITLGIIFGDIGTSPLYTFQTIMTEGGKVTEELVLGSHFLCFLDADLTDYV